MKTELQIYTITTDTRIEKQQNNSEALLKGTATLTISIFYQKELYEP